uniref:Guanylate cyclase domain-containing protein n=1 Tax=Oncorhynchus kisutch TaxID=8019 RepID=A0A8C7GYB2_ONCKI
MGWITGEGEIENSYKISKIAAHVPDLVVYSTLTNDIPYVENFHGVLLFADVSGFTNLTEKFSLSSKKGYGADEFTRPLNSYIGETVSRKLAVVSLSDAILALWTVERVQLSEVISLVVKCSLNIQDQCGVREMEVGCQLKVKIGISAGKLSKVIVGGEISQYFVVIGRAVDEVRLAEGLAVASTIILSPNAWELCEIERESRVGVQVRCIKREPSFSVEKYQDSIGTSVEHEKVTRKCVRRASRLMPNAELEKTLRKYVMKNVLSEMRPATIVFVNMLFKGGESDQEQCTTIHQAAIGISQQIVKHHRRVNKVFMFDKGCTFLCLFGLPGDKRENESALHDLCQKEIRNLKTVSVGVTTGPVFCGGTVLCHCHLTITCCSPFYIILTHILLCSDFVQVLPV